MLTYLPAIIWFAIAAVSFYMFCRASYDVIVKKYSVISFYVVTFFLFSLGSAAVGFSYLRLVP